MPFNDNLPNEFTDPWYASLVTAWNNIKTFVNGLETTLGTKASSSDLTSGLATKVNSATYTAGMALKADLVGGVLPANQLPALAVTEFLGASANQAAMLAKVGQQGDWTTRTDLGTVWVITGADPTVLGNWTQLTYPTAPVTTVAGRTGAIVLAAADIASGTFVDARIPALAISKTTGLQAALDGKADDSQIIVLGVLDHDETPPAPGVYLRRPAP
jgi:hypothetical protein